MCTAGSRSLPWQTSRGACCARTGGAGLAGRRARMPPAPPPQAPLAAAEGSGPSPLAAYRARAYAEQAQPRGLLDGYTPEGARAASMPGTGAAFHTCHSRAERPAAASASTGRRESQAGACGRLVGLHSLPINHRDASRAGSLAPQHPTLFMSPRMGRSGPGACVARRSGAVGRRARRKGPPRSLPRFENARAPCCTPARGYGRGTVVGRLRGGGMLTGGGPLRSSPWKARLSHQRPAARRPCKEETQRPGLRGAAAPRRTAALSDAFYNPLPLRISCTFGYIKCTRPARPRRRPRGRAPRGASSTCRRRR